MKVCKKHGQLSEENIRTYIRHRRGRHEVTTGCKLCHRETAGNARKNNRERINILTRQDRKDNPEKYKKWSADSRKRSGPKRITQEIIRCYGLTLDKYNKMFIDQNNLCGICNKPESRKSRTSGKICRLGVDHCHETNKIRGLLCHHCNMLLGVVKDSVPILQAAINYLKKHES